MHAKSQDYAVRNHEKLKFRQEENLHLTQIKDLLSMRDRLVKTQLILKSPVNEMSSFLPKKYVKFLESIQKSVVEEIRSAIENLDKQLKQTINTDTSIKHKVSLAMSVPGIGLTTAAYLLCATRNFTAYQNGRQLASYAGCAPFPNTSGSSHSGKTRTSRISNHKLKSLLHMAALSCIRKGMAFHRYYLRKVKEGKPKVSVVNAVRCKSCSG